MVSNLKRSGLAVRAEADAVCALCNGGYLRIFEGAMSDDADAPNAGEVMLSEHRFSDRAFGAADSSGVAKANAIAPDPSAMNDGTPGFFRAYTRDEQPVFQDTAGPNGALKTSVKLIAAGSVVHVTDLSYVARKSNG